MNMEDNKVITIANKGVEVVSVGKTAFLFGMLFTAGGMVAMIFSHLLSVPIFITAGWAFLPSGAGQSATQSDPVVTRPPQVITRRPEPQRIPITPSAVPPVSTPTPKQGPREEQPGDSEALQAPRPRPKRKRE
jgi:hypothetical protein